MENASVNRQSPEFDFLILADRAEAINGKLYMMGGGWDGVGVANIDEPIAFSIALAVMVPWHATNQDHMLTLSLQDVDGKELVQLQVGFRTGRPPNLEEGADQRIMFALPLALKFPGVGTYCVVGRVGQDEKRVRMRVFVVPQNPLAPSRPAQMPPAQ